MGTSAARPGPWELQPRSLRCSPAVGPLTGNGTEDNVPARGCVRAGGRFLQVDSGASAEAGSLPFAFVGATGSFRPGHPGHGCKPGLRQTLP